MYHDRDRSTFDDAAPIPTTTATTPSNVVPLRPERAGKASKAKQSRKAPEPKPRKYAWGDMVREDENLSPSAKVVAWYLCGLFDAEEEAAFPTHGTIAKRTGMKPKTVQRAIRELEDAGCLRRELGTGLLGGNKYRPTWAKLSQVPVDVVKSDTPGGQIRHPGVVSSDQGGRSDLTPIIQAQHKPEDQHEDKREENARAFAVAPAPAVAPAGLDGLGDEQPQAAPAPKPLTFNEEWDVFVSRFPGETMGTKWRGRFCALRIAGVTLADVLETLDRDIAMTGPDTVSRSMPKFLGDHFGHIGTWRQHDDDEDDFPLPPGCTVIPSSWADDPCPF